MQQKNVTRARVSGGRDRWIVVSGIFLQEIRLREVAFKLCETGENEGDGQTIRESFCTRRWV